MIHVCTFLYNLILNALVDILCHGAEWPVELSMRMWANTPPIFLRRVAPTRA